jgi:hypothetical protein
MYESLRTCGSFKSANHKKRFGSLITNRKSAKCHMCVRSAKLTNYLTELICGQPTFGSESVAFRNFFYLAFHQEANVFSCLFTYIRIPLHSSKHTSGIVKCYMITNLSISQFIRKLYDIKCWSYEKVRYL